jgi:hypothetical protein
MRRGGGITGLVAVPPYQKTSLGLRWQTLLREGIVSLDDLAEGELRHSEPSSSID